jgi:hypothetical protein
MKFCVCVRSFLEGPYLDFFIEYYISLGFDKILILKSDKEAYYCKPEFTSRVQIVEVDNTGNKILQENIQRIKSSGCDWTFFPDTDEILILNKQYSNIKDFTQKKLKECDQINSFYFRWAMIEKCDIDKDTSFKNILNTYNMFSSRFIKSMVRTSAIRVMYDPHSCGLDNNIIYFEGNLININKSVHDLQEYSYHKDATLIHLHTRSIHNVILKSLFTVLGSKHIVSLDGFIKYINDFTEDTDIIESFKNLVGQKAKLPFHHSESELCKIDLSNYTIPEYSNNVINRVLEKNLIIRALNKFNIDDEKYEMFVEALNKEIKTNFRRFYKD